MFRERTVFVSGNLGSVSAFRKTAGKYFNPVEDYRDRFELCKHLMAENTDFLIIFTDYENAGEVIESLRQVPQSNRLIAVFGRKVPSGLEYDGIYDYIDLDAGPFYEELFMKRLLNEVENRRSFIRLQNEMSEFYKIGKSLMIQKDSRRLLEMIIRSSMELTLADAATIYLLVDGETGQWSSVRDGDIGSRLLKFEISKNTSLNTDLEASVFKITSSSIIGHTVISGKPTRIDDAYVIPPNLHISHDNSFDLSTGYRTKSVLTIPMKDSEDSILGIIQLINKKRNKNVIIDFARKNPIENVISFTAADEEVMYSLAGQAAVVLQNCLLQRELNSLIDTYRLQNIELKALTTRILKAHEEERKRIAREIHDGPAQSVVNLSFKAELCKKYMELNDMKQLGSLLQDLSISIKDSVKDIRSVIYDLKPSFLDEGLVKALENHVGKFMQVSGIPVELSVYGDDKAVEDYLVPTVFRVVQEALSNIHKYSRATKVVMTIKVENRMLSLEISDNGIGFDAGSIQANKSHRLEGGFGLEGMMERIELVKGSINIISKPGCGTTIQLSIPAGDGTNG